MKKMWKFLRLEKAKIVSDYSKSCTWKTKEWKTCEGEVVCCSNGFHASERILDALNYVKGEVLAQVEVKGKSHKEKDKEAWASMRIVNAYKWTAMDSVKLSIFAAKQVIDIYEKKYPNDDRPRKAIEAAEAYVKNPRKDAAARAAYDARAAYAAYAAYDAADDAARAAAYDAYDAADDAARAAAYAARAAYAAARAAYDARAAYAAYDARAAYDAAYDAARAAAYDAEKILSKIEKWLQSHIKNLEEIK